MSERRNDDHVYAVGYRRIPGGAPRRGAWWPIARTMLALAWRRRATKLALLLCLMVVGVFGVWLVGQLLIKRYTGGGAMGLVGPAQLVGEAQEAFSNFLQSQFYVTAIAIAVIAGGAVADDRHAGAFELYFSRPLGRMDYALGKLAGAALVPLATMVVPVLLLWLLAVGIAPPDLRRELWWLVVPALCGATLAGAALTTTVVGVSAISERSRAVSIAYVAALVVSSGIFEGLTEAGLAWAGYLAPQRDLRTVVDALLDVGGTSLAGQLVHGRLPANDSVLLSLAGLLAYTGAGLGLLAMRLKREVQS